MHFFVKDNPVPEFPRLTHFGYCGDDTARDIPVHVHLGYEIVYIVSGHGEVVLRNGEAPRRLDADDVMVTRPRIRHRFVVRGENLAYIWFGLQTDPSVLRTAEHKMTSFPVLPPTDVDTDWLGQPLFRSLFEGLGSDMKDSESLVLHGMPELARCFSNIKDEVTASAPYREALIYASLVEVFTHIRRRLESDSPSGRYGVLKRLTAYIRAHYNENINLERLSHYSGYSRTYLSRVFSKDTGRTVSRYIEDVRMERARELLVQGVPVGEAARDCGFSSTSYFSRRFTKRAGESPREWNRRNKTPRG